MNLKLRPIKTREQKGGRNEAPERIVAQKGGKCKMCKIEI